MLRVILVLFVAMDLGVKGSSPNPICDVWKSSL